MVPTESGANVMAKAHLLTGLTSGAVDTTSHEITFHLSVSGRAPFAFVAKHGPVAQMISGLSRMLSELRRVLDSEKKMEAVSAENVAATHIQKDRWANVVLMQLITPGGVPYTFALPPQVASDIADRLKTESAKPHQAGIA
jgi:hypothetical protein